MLAQTMTYRCPHCQRPVDVDLLGKNDLLVCPNPGCGKPFKVEVPAAEPVSELVLPPGTAAAQKPMQAMTPTAPAAPLAQTVTEAPEQPVSVVHLDMIRRYPFRSLGYILIMLAAVIGALLFLFKGFLFIAVACLVGGGFFLFRFVGWWLRMKNTTMTITTKRFILESGVFHKITTEVNLQEVDDIQINQTFLQRLLDVGDLRLMSTSGETQNSVLIMAVPSPKAVACMIRDCNKAA